MPAIPPAAPVPAYRWLHLDPPFGLIKDATGDPHLKLLPMITAGRGIIAATDPVTSQVQISLDTAVVAYRSTTIPVPGKCDLGSGVWAADTHYVYMCVQDEARTGFIWVAEPVLTTWPAVPTTRNCTEDAAGNVTCVDPPAPIPEAVYAAVTGEVPTYTAGGTAGGVPVGKWLLAYVPELDLACTRNDVPQTVGVEYSQNGNELISGIWQAADAIKCSYRRRVIQ